MCPQKAPAEILLSLFRLYAMRLTVFSMNRKVYNSEGKDNNHSAMIDRNFNTITTGLTEFLL